MGHSLWSAHHLPKLITVTPCERSRLVKLGAKFGSAIATRITIVSARTFSRWKAAAGAAPDKKKSKRKPGRPRTEEDTRKLVLKLARENG
jgi:hypothetical protein